MTGSAQGGVMLFNRSGMLLIVLLLGSIVLPGCAVVRKVPMPPYTETVQEETVPAGPYEPVAFDRVVVSVRRGDIIGAWYTGFSEAGGSLCNQDGASEMTWASSHAALMDSDNLLGDTFIRTMREKGYDAVGDSSVMFDREAESARARYRVGARITGITSNLCKEYSSWDGSDLHRTSGEVFLSVEWSVYSVFAKQVVYSTRTDGYHKLARGVPNGGELVFAEAFAAAVQNLAMKKDFSELLRTKQGGAATPAAGYDEPLRPLSLSRLQPFEEPVEAHIRKVGEAVVTIRQGSGHGSGFFISHDGYILTNAHVVGEAGEVAVMLGGSLELSGTVLRVNRRRDVALVKVALNRAAALPVETEPVRQAQAVFAIGTPGMLDLHNTVTRGIVSAVRYDEQMQQPVIQADVDIQPGNSGGPLVDEKGNVVGISVAGYLTSEMTSMGINLFIPIEDALSSLHILPESQTEGGRKE